MMTSEEQKLFDAIILRLQQGGQAGAVSILKHWIKNEVSKNEDWVMGS